MGGRASQKAAGASSAQGWPDEYPTRNIRSVLAAASAVRLPRVLGRSIDRTTGAGNSAWPTPLCRPFEARTSAPRLSWALRHRLRAADASPLPRHYRRIAFGANGPAMTLDPKVSRELARIKQQRLGRETKARGLPAIALVSSNASTTNDRPRLKRHSKALGLPNSQCGLSAGFGPAVSPLASSA